MTRFSIWFLAAACSILTLAAPLFADLTVDNGELADYTVETRTLTGGEHVQSLQIDIGTGTSASPVTTGNPLPVTGTLTCNAGTLNGAALDSSVDGVEALLTSIEANQLADGHNVTVDNATLAVAQSGSWTNACTQSGAWTVTANLGTLGDAATETTLAAINGKITAVDTGAVVVASSALPTGAATAANQSTIAGHVDGIEGLLTTIDADTGILAGVDYATQTTLAAVLTELGAKTEPADTQNVTGTLTCNAGTGTFTVSGTVTANAGTGTFAVSAASLPLPSGAATSALQTTGNTSLSSIATNTSNTNAKFTAAAALADNQSNPTTTRVGAALQGWDGTNWDRIPGTSADGLLVNLGANNDISGTVACNAGTNLNTSALALDSSVDGVEALLTTIDSDTSNLGAILTELGQKTEPSDTQTVSGTVQATNETVSSVTEATCGVTTSSASCLASSGSRNGGYLQNVSDTDVWCSLGGTATAAAPTTLIKVNGLLDFTTGGVVYTGAINCIHAGSGTKNVTVVSF